MEQDVAFRVADAGAPLVLASCGADLLAKIPLAAGTILDIGCGTGALAAAYRRMNPKAVLLGVEADPVMAALAASHMHRVAVVDPETDPLPFDACGGIDCIIYDDVLEHLRDPWAALLRHAELLSSDGIMLIRVANAEYWRLAERLLRGTCDDSFITRGGGFSHAAMRGGLVRAGLLVCDVTGREPDGDAAARFAASLALGLEALGIDPRDYAKRAGPSHLIWRVSRAPCQRLIVAGNMLNPVGGVSHVRVVHPIEAMATDPMVTAGVTDQIEISQPGDGAARIFVLHRPALVGEQGPALLRGLTDAGFLIVTEFDDLPEHFGMMRLGGALGFYGVHAVQTSTIAMADALRQYNPEIAVFPNAVRVLPEVRNFTDPEVVTMFFGALNRERDWLPYMPSLNAVAAMAGGRLRFEVVHDQAFFDALETPYKTFTPTCDYDTYLRILGGCEISFMPLSDTAFNRAKSDLKYIEAASCRVAALASGVVYANSIDDGRTGLLFRDPIEFSGRLLHLLATPGLAVGMGEAARGYVVDERMLAYQVAPRIGWYRSLWGRREALSEARRVRMLRYRVAA